MPTPPPTGTPVVVWVLTCAVVFLGLVCTVLLGIVWKRLKDRPEEVLASMREALGAVKVDIEDLAAQLGRMRTDVDGLKNNRRAADKTLVEQVRWLDGVATAVQENRDDLRSLENDVSRLQEEQGWTPVPRKAARENRKRRPVPRGRAPIGLGPPEEDTDPGKGG